MLQLIEKIYTFSRNSKKIILIFCDTQILFFSYLLSAVLTNKNLELFFYTQNFKAISLSLIISIVIFNFSKVYTTVVRYITMDHAYNLFFSIVISSSLLFIISNILNVYLSISFPIIYGMISFILIASSRLLIKSIYLRINVKNLNQIAIFGTNTNAKILNKVFDESFLFNSILFFSETNHLNKEINGKKVYNFLTNYQLINQFNIREIYITEEIKDFTFFRKIILEIIKENPLKVKILNNFKKNYLNNNIINNFKNLKIIDLLVDDSKLKVKGFKNLTSKNIMVTGAGGSIGNALCEEILKNKPKSLFLVDHSEYFLYELREKLLKIINTKNIKININFYLGSIQNSRFLESLFKNNKVDIIFHSAAYKHVPIVEDNIIESLENNVFSTEKIVKIAIKNNVSNFVLISSDKAVKPTNVMGASKRLAELICLSYNSKQKITKFTVTRFGNVINSSGSVIPMFQKQINDKIPLSLTHIAVERFFMSLNEAAKLVLQTIRISKGGEVFLLDMGKSIKILDLAKMMIHLNGYKFKITNKKQRPFHKTMIIKIVGLRQGEKLFEELSINKKLQETKIKNILIANDPIISNKEIHNMLKNIKDSFETFDKSKIINTLKNCPLNFNNKD